MMAMERTGSGAEAPQRIEMPGGGSETSFEEVDTSCGVTERKAQAGAAAPSTVSSGASTTLSGKERRGSAPTESDGHEFLRDFEEFGSSAKVDAWLQSGRGVLGLEGFRELEGEDELLELQEELEQRLGGVGGLGPPPDLGPPGGRRAGCGTSRSVTNLRARSGGVRAKKSMPSLRPAAELDVGVGPMQPQFLVPYEEPWNLSPTQYTVTRDDKILTPQLNKLPRRAKNLDEFKEDDCRRQTRTKKVSASHRLRTIKQEIDHNTPVRAGKMSYNPSLKKWEGNEEALERFRTLDEMDGKRVLLITNNRRTRGSPARTATAGAARGARDAKVVGKMVFDEENLRWLQIGGGEVDPFADIQETIKSKPLPQSGAACPSKFVKSHRSDDALDGFRENGQRFSSTRHYSLPRQQTHPTFRVSSQLLEKFYHEENRWVRHVGGWFSAESVENSRKEDVGHYDQSFMYEIRKMVMNSARN
ncbi:ACL090Cp [Eremothecium gossypii ATCC 10895]|uniref:ACL090Cp n=1 Tax=Eremothecium gossypii (strain ATCC 10895 / CBS 109.51 / FGSC 9923 / NRRL Y-1056) TaxID=284811 RepID=Q75CK9_EREGS|nr:ACL090Cp [Eremothecium gossypii ATCC 10895]AAS51138.1 ACL090Cp [Eremothecium gossypii ATCC 10895]AEY95428.1 FACL090Cp [Eremothecium gossypii FDAG1]